MVNVFDHLTNIKVNCFKRYMNNNEIYTFTNTMYPMMIKIFSLGNEYLTTVMKSIRNPFMSDVLKHVKKIFDKIEVKDMNDVLYERLFCNKNICIDNRTVYFQNWIQGNVSQIYHLIDEQTCAFLTFDEFVTKYPNIRTNFLQYNGLVRSIKRYIHNVLNVNNFHTDNVQMIQAQEPVCWQSLRKSKHEIKSIIRTKPKTEHKSTIKWNNSFDRLDWKNIFRICHKTTVDTKIKWFQFRLLYRLLPTKRFLMLRKIKNNSLCDFCNQNDETICHLFWECPYVQHFWDDLATRFVSKLPHACNLSLSKELILFGCKENVKTDKPFDLLLLAAKYHIYLCKFSETLPSFDIFLKQFKLRYRLEKLYSDNISKEQFDVIWMNYATLLN